LVEYGSRIPDHVIMPHYGLSLHSFSLYSNDIRSSSPDLRLARGRTAPLELPNRPSAEGNAGSAQPHHTVCGENALTLPKQLFVLHLNQPFPFNFPLGGGKEEKKWWLRRKTNDRLAGRLGRASGAKKPLAKQRSQSSL